MHLVEWNEVRLPPIVKRFLEIQTDSSTSNAHDWSVLSPYRCPIAKTDSLERVFVLRDPGSKRGHSHATRSVISRHSVRRPNIRILFHRKRRTRGRRRRTRRVSRKKSFHRRIDKITLTLTRNNLQLRTLEFYHRAIVLTFQGSTDKDL